MDYRLGLQFHLLSEAPLRKGLEPVRRLRLQVASPPPKRLDGSNWFDGLRVNDGTERGRAFDRGDEIWRELGVFAPEKNELKNEMGLRNLCVPDPDTLIFNEIIEVPLVDASRQRRTATTLLRSGEPVVGEADHFLSVYYETPVINGVRLTAAAVTYHIQGTLAFIRDADEWIAASLTEFEPENRESADYIAPVDEG
jgi:hypothetical protein